MSHRFLSRSNYAKKPEIVLNVNSTMHKLVAGTIGPDETSWKKRRIHYSAQSDTSMEDSIVFYVEARASDGKSLLHSLRKVEVKD